MKFDSIVIVGGGSAGWMTATTLIKAFPEKDITLVESASLKGSVVGESTTQLMKRWQYYVGITDDDMIRHCDATHKLSVGFENFHQIGESFQYPFGRIDERRYNVPQWFIYQSISGAPFTDFVDDFSPISYCLKHNRVPTYPVANGWTLDKDSAWHFDVNKFNSFLCSRAKKLGVKHIVTDVQGSVKDCHGYITHLNTKDGEIHGDLFFDCTGFRRVLCGDVSWVGFNNKTYTDRAWAAVRPYKDKRKELKLFTNSVALDYGWVWEAPSQKRIGTGYNYCSEYITDDEALAEFKEYLGPVADEMTFRHLKMRNGMSERMWDKNVISIGLSGAFIEPLESNGIMSIHEFLLQFVNVTHNKTKLNNFDAHTFNHNCREQFLYFADFITLHYAMTARDDTPFWRDVQQQEFTDSKLLKEVYDAIGCPYYKFDSKVNWEQLGATLFMLAGHKINPYNQFKQINGEFWGDTINDMTKNLNSITDAIKHEQLMNLYDFPESVDYYDRILEP